MIVQKLHDAMVAAMDIPAMQERLKKVGALPFALSMNRIFNGVSRPFFGWMSDHLGREQTMGIAFTLEGIAIILLSRFGTNPMAFIVLTALVFFAYGEIYSLFPAICGDAYGRKFASANAGLLYVAKGVASLLVPLASLISASGMGGPACSWPRR